MNSHDGLKDALTHLALPALLYEELRRELARASRSGVLISGVKIVLYTQEITQVPLDGNHSNRQAARSDNSELLDREYLLLAQSMQYESRREDVCARMGDREFLILLIGFKASSEIFIDRLLKRWYGERDHDARLKGLSRPNVYFSFITSVSDESTLDFLNRLDLAPVHSS